MTTGYRKEMNTRKHGRAGRRLASPRLDVSGITSPSWITKVIPESGPPPSDRHRKERTPSGRTHLTGGWWARIAYAVIDVICICLDATLAVYFRFVPSSFRNAFHQNGFGLSGDFPLSQYGAFLLLYVTLIVLFCQGQDLYRTPRMRPSWDETLRVVKAIALATLFLVGFIFLSGSKLVSREVVSVASLLNIIVLSAWRLWKRQFVIHRAAQGIGARNALIIGAGKVGQSLARQLEENKLLGFRFKGFLDSNHHTDPRLLGKIEDLAQVGRTEFVDDIFITIPSERELVKRVTLEAQRNRWNVKVVPELYDGLGWNAPLRYVGPFPMMDLHWESIPALGMVVKRVLDVVLAAIGLLLFAPLMVTVAVLVKLDSTGPILYRSPRVGRKGQIFSCYKFRTMMANADALKDGLRHRNERTGPFFKIADDPRVTHAGRFLRKYSLDELPQLWNVLKGDMSLVGPRPHPVDDCQQYSLDNLRRLEVKPGITGLWQVTARQDPSFETNMRLDLEYIENWSLWLDASILLKTMPALLKGLGE
jgi:exopolysaccharide biosynthesis polyprenyl glycosylphosphotransferase